MSSQADLRDGSVVAVDAFLLLQEKSPICVIGMLETEVSLQVSNSELFLTVKWWQWELIK